MRLVVLVLGLVLLGCGARDPVTEVKTLCPDGSEYLSWSRYVLVRFPADDVAPGLQPAVLYRHEAEGWVEAGRSSDGFHNLQEVMTYIPEMDESGVAAFRLK